jgi:hypothetical protein
VLSGLFVLLWIDELVQKYSSSVGIAETHATGVGSGSTDEEESRALCGAGGWGEDSDLEGVEVQKKMKKNRVGNNKKKTHSSW